MGKLSALRVTVEGKYISRVALRDSTGAAHKEHVPYSETFDLDPKHKDAELSHLLADGGPLKLRLAAKDVNFRGLYSYSITQLLPIFQEDPKPEEDPAPTKKKAKGD